MGICHKASGAPSNTHTISTPQWRDRTVLEISDMGILHLGAIQHLKLTEIAPHIHQAAFNSAYSMLSTSA